MMTTILKRSLPWTAAVIVGLSAMALLQFAQIERERARKETRHWKMETSIRELRHVWEFNAILPRDIYQKRGSPMISWRATLAIAANPIPGTEYDLSVPWNVGRNVRLGQHANWLASERGGAGIMALRGAGTCFDSDLKLAEAPGDCVLLIEAFDTESWVKPTDIDLSKRMAAGAVEVHDMFGDARPGIFVGFADGEVWFLKPETPLSALAALSQAN